MQIKAKFVREARSFGDGPTRFIIAQGSMDESPPDCPVRSHSFTLTGTAPAGSLVPGIEYVFEGDFKKHKKYGWQYAFTSYTRVKPHGREGVVRWLSNAPRVGPVLAARIWETFKQDSIQTLKDKPEIVAQRAGINLAACKAASAYLIEHEDMETVMVELEQMFSQHSRTLNRRVINQLVQKYGIGSADKIRENPFRLLEFRGVAFPTAYRVWCELGHESGAIECQTECIKYLVEQSSNTWSKIGVIADQLEKYLSCSPDVKNAVGIGVKRCELVECDGLVTSFVRANTELSLAEDIQRIANGPNRWPAIDSLYGLTEHQRAQAKAACRRAMGVLVGSPGTGKTYTLSKIVGEIARVYGQESVAVLSFTGKAAARAMEMMASFQLPKVHVSTIHRALIPVPGDSGGYDGTGWKFVHNRDKRLKYRFIFLEESSMDGTDISQSLFEAIPDGCNVMWVGDENQLPPVSNGCPLYDVMESEICGVGRLTEIHRNSGMIERACASLRDNGIFETCSSPDIETGGNLMHIECRGAAQTLNLNKAIGFCRRLGLDPIRDMQVITAVNQNTKVCRSTLNDALQKLLNPNGEPDGSGRFRVGDKVVCRKNSWFTNILTNEEMYVANGDQGRVVAVSEDSMEIESCGGLLSSKTSKSSCIWELAYAITSHLSQGSEWPFVAVMIDDSWGARSVMSREWFTTAESRAKLFCVNIGPWDVVRDCCKRVELKGRVTRLRELLGEAAP